MKILGIHLGHDSAAALVIDGALVADVAEERFSRIKHDGSFPLRSIEYCLKTAGISSEDLDAVALPFQTLPKSFRTMFRIADRHRGLQFDFGALRPVEIQPDPRFNTDALPLYMPPLRLSPRCTFFLAGHHAAHAASAFYTSGSVRERSLVATLDGVGEDVSIALWRGEHGALTLLHKWGGDASLGWIYSNVTEAVGWRHGSDEWKVMGLAPYGTPVPGALTGFHPVFTDGQLTAPHDYGAFGVWQDHGAQHWHGRDARQIMEIAERVGREGIAAEAQRIVEDQVRQLLVPWLEKERTSRLMCAGGFFLNVKANQMLWDTGTLSDQWIYPNPGDAGLAAGAALLSSAMQCGCVPDASLDHLSLGPSFSSPDIESVLKERGLVCREVANAAEACVPYLLANNVVAWFQGRMESGPRALGNRSILMSPQHAENKDTINAKVKFREAFRPFCPSLLARSAADYLIRPRDERFMMSSFTVREAVRSQIPAVVHVDHTTRPQLVHKRISPLYHELIERFEERTGVPALLNTSFNIKGEPVVCTPREACRTFFDSGIDVMIIDRFVVEKPCLDEGIPSYAEPDLNLAR